MKFLSLAIAVTLAFVASLQLRAAVWSDRLEGWENGVGSWSTAVDADTSDYPEGSVIPFRFVSSYSPSSVHVLKIRYNHTAGGASRFVDYLATVNSTVAGVPVLSGITLPADQQTARTWPIPVDPQLAQARPGFVQPAGVLTTYNVSQLSFSSTYTTTAGVRELLVCFTVSGLPRTGNRTVVIAFGSHLATEQDWGVGNGSADFPGTTTKVFAQADRRSMVEVPIEVAAEAPSADLQVTQTGPSTLCFGTQATFVVTVKNLGPSLAEQVELTDLLPANGTLISATGSTGTVSGTGPVKLSVANLASGAEAVLTLTVQMTGQAQGENTASVTSTTTDPQSGNNSSSISIDSRDLTAPVITVPADYVVDLADGACEMAVGYEGAPATAVDDCGGAVVLTYNPPSGTILGPGEHEVTVTARDGSNNESTATFKVLVRDNPNISWPVARFLPLVPVGNGLVQATFTQCLNQFDQSRWYRFSVKPGDQVIAVLQGLTENYDLVLFRDIQQTYDSLVNQVDDLPLLNAQFAPDAFSPAAFSPDAFSPAAFSPAAFSPAAFSPAAFSPAAFSPAAFSPAAFSPAAFSPDAFSPAAFSPAAFSPDAFSPAAFSPAAFSPAAFSPAAFSPAAFSPAAFSDAQIRSVVAVSAFPGTANEGLVANVWNNTGEFYLRVRGRNGVFQPGAAFELAVYVMTGTCEDVELTPPAGTGTGPAVTSGDFKTLILTDSERLLDDGSKAAMNQQLAVFAARPEVKGKIIDLAAYPQVKWFQQQADVNYDCPFAKNLAAGSIRDVIRQWRAQNPVANVVLVGSDSVIPFFRYPDQAMLGPEENYIPPVNTFSASEASLRLNFVLGQDAYGASCELPLKAASLPLPEIPVGRLVEAPVEILGMVQAYLETAAGVLPAPTSALVTGYDFLTDAALGVETELEAGMGRPVDTLIAPAASAPAEGWTAAQLRQALFTKRLDLVYLAGHFSAFSALAADYQTVILANELQTAPNSFKNSILFSAGCHSGYNAVDQDGIAQVTPQPDWAQAAARRQATLIAGTGYQYGDTDFIEYSERIYLQFAKELRTGTGPVSVGQALLRAKRYYLATTPAMRGIHEKAFHEATLFGLPMLSVAMPGDRIPTDVEASEVGALSGFPTNPGLLLGLQQADLSVVPNFVERTMVLQDIGANTSVTAKYLEGSDGVLVNPAEPVLPLESLNVDVSQTTLRGVGWRGGTYEDEAGVIPLTGAATTEIRGVHSSFLTDVLYPVRFWAVNYFDLLCGGSGEVTRLNVWPAQFVSDKGTDVKGTLRRHTRADFRLFYSDNSTIYQLNDGSGTIIPALSAPPSINGVFSSNEASVVRFRVNVTGNPAAGIQAVWLTYTATKAPFYGRWIPFDLTQNATDTTLWEGELDLAGTGLVADDLRYLVQAVNGVGLVSMHTRQGAFHVPNQTEGWEGASALPTSVELLAPPESADFGSQVVLRARWTAAGSDPANRTLVFTLGNQQVAARTDATGVAQATLNVLTVPGDYDLKVSYSGEEGLASSNASAPFQILPTATFLNLGVQSFSAPAVTSGDVSVLLSDANGPLIERSVLFVATGTSTIVRTAITDLTGRARMGTIPSGTYSVTAYFGKLVTLPDGTTLVDLRDVRYLGSQITTRVSFDTEPPAGYVVVNKPVLRNPNHKMVTVTVCPFFTDPSGTPVTRILSVTSNEPENGTGDGDVGPDIQVTGPVTVRLRAERAGTGTGRIYTLVVETKDPLGNKRIDTLTVTVPK